jgi:hypothetical protein
VLAFAATIVVAPAASASNPQTNTYLSGSLCAAAYAGVQTWLYSSGYDAENLITCGSPTSWPAAYQSVDYTLYDAPYPAASTCATGGTHPLSFAYVSHVPAAQNFVPSTCTDFFIYGCYWVANDSYAGTYIGYPPTWLYGEAISDFWPYFARDL